MTTEREYYKFNELKFDSRCMLWLIRHLATLKEGRYPPDPVGSSSYVDTGLGKRTVRSRAPFENAELIAGEVEARLERCGLDGLILKALTLWEETPEYLAKCLGKPVWSIIERRASALKYISGWRRKRSDYKTWREHKTIKEIAAQS